MDYDQTKIPEMYNRGRDHGPAFLDQWMRVVAGHVLDLRFLDEQTMKFTRISPDDSN
jgi:hypothetical protein